MNAKLKNTAKYRKTPKGVLTNIYHKMKERSKNKGLPSVTFTLSEFQGRYLEDNRFLELHRNWECSGYLKQEKPSADRINPLLGYSLENIRFVAWATNRRKADWEKSFLHTASIDMLDENGRKMRSFESIKEAHMQTGIGSSLIIQCCQKRVRKAKGYIFRYRGDKHRTFKTKKYCNIHDDNLELLEGSDDR